MNKKQLDLEFDIEDLIEWQDLKDVINEYPYKDIIKKNLFIYNKKFILNQIKKGVTIERRFYTLDDYEGFSYKFIQECIKEIRNEFQDQILESEDIVISISYDDNRYSVGESVFTFHVSLKPTKENCKEVIQSYIERIKKEGTLDKNNCLNLLRKLKFDYINNIMGQVKEEIEEIKNDNRVNR
jgi:hypothetical protein